MVDREMREVGDTRPALVGILRTRSIESVNEIVTGWIRIWLTARYNLLC